MEPRVFRDMYTVKTWIREIEGIKFLFEHVLRLRNRPAFAVCPGVRGGVRLTDQSRHEI